MFHDEETRREHALEEYRNTPPIVDAYPDFVTDYPDYPDIADGGFTLGGGSITIASGGTIVDEQEELKEKIKQAVLDILNEEANNDE